MDEPHMDEDAGIQSVDPAATDELAKAKAKLIMDFGLEQKAPERVTVEVLRQLIRERPERMTQAVRKWLHPE